MIVSSHQPIFLPWPGFFYKALRAEAMVLLDCVQFPLGRSWMTRNRLKSDQGEFWLRVPVWRTGRGMQSIRGVEICDETDWRRRQLIGIRQQYANAPYLDDHLRDLESLYAREPQRLVDFNLGFIRYVGDALGLKRKLILQSDLGVSGQGTDLLVSLCRALNAHTYLTLPPAEKHLNAEPFRASGIQLSFARFCPPVYPQLWGDFRYNLSALDLLLNCGAQKSVEIIARA
jgi:WbqC-like protein family